MPLVDNEIVAAIDSKNLVITPFDTSLVQPASYDLRLHNDVLVDTTDMSNVPVDPLSQTSGWGATTVSLDDYWVLQPKQFVLASTIERVWLANGLAAQVEGKSSLARIGLQVHCAGFIDPGFDGQITLELFNMSNRSIVLRSGMLIAQIKFDWLTATPNRFYGDVNLNSKYQGQMGPTVSEYWRNY